MDRNKIGEKTMTEKTDKTYNEITYHFNYDCKMSESLKDTPKPMICSRCYLPIKVPGQFYVSVYDSTTQTTMYYHWSCYMHP